MFRPILKQWPFEPTSPQLTWLSCLQAGWWNLWVFASEEAGGSTETNTQSNKPTTHNITNTAATIIIWLTAFIPYMKEHQYWGSLMLEEYKGSHYSILFWRLIQTVCLIQINTNYQSAIEPPWMWVPSKKANGDYDYNEHTFCEEDEHFL